MIVHGNIVINNYQQDSRVLYTFQLLGKFLDIFVRNFICLKTLNSEISFIKVWFTDQNFIPLEDRRLNKHQFSYQLKCKNKK